MTLSNSEPSSLLSAPLSGGVRAAVKYSRPNTENIGYQNQSDHFRLDNIVKSYNHQYYKVRNWVTSSPLPCNSISFRFTMPDSRS